MGTSLAFERGMLEQHRPSGINGPAKVAEPGATHVTDEVRALREQLARRTQQLEQSELRCMEAMEASQRQAEILALYAHDLRSPLSAIIGYAELLEMGVPESIPDCAVECVSRIREAAHNLDAMLDDLLARPHIAPQLR
jgi:signal transduction histidine kinase